MVMSVSCPASERKVKLKQDKGGWEVASVLFCPSHRSESSRSKRQEFHQD